MKFDITQALHRLYLWAYLQAEFAREKPAIDCEYAAMMALHLIEHPDADAEQKLLGDYDGNTEQVRCNIVLDDFHRSFVSVHHHPSIRKLKPIPTECIAPVEVRQERMERWGYLFHAFGGLGDQYGLYRILGAATKSGPWGGDAFEHSDPKVHATVLNALNGGADLDYEGLFPESADIFRAIKLGKFHLSEADVDDKSGRSPLSVPDIMLGAYFERRCRNASVPDEARKRAVRAIGRILDSEVGNTERARLYHELRGIFGRYSEPEPSCSELLAKLSRNASFARADVVITLNGGDLGSATYAARQAFPNSFFLPIGGQSPHQVKENLGEISHYTESDEMRATLLLHDYRNRHEDFPDHPLGDGPPYLLPRYSVLPSDHVSIDTAGNAAQAKPRLAMLSKLLGRTLEVAIASSQPHAQRARAEFMEAIPSDIARFHAYPVGASAIHTYAFELMKPVAIGQTFCEYLKRLYAVSVA